MIRCEVADDSLPVGMIGSEVPALGVTCVMSRELAVALAHEGVGVCGREAHEVGLAITVPVTNNGAPVGMIGSEVPAPGVTRVMGRELAVASAHEGVGVCGRNAHEVSPLVTVPVTNDSL